MSSCCLVCYGCNEIRPFVQEYSLLLFDIDRRDESECPLEGRDILVHNESIVFGWDSNRQPVFVERGRGLLWVHEAFCSMPLLYHLRYPNRYLNFIMMMNSEMYMITIWISDMLEYEIMLKKMDAMDAIVKACVKRYLWEFQTEYQIFIEAPIVLFVNKREIGVLFTVLGRLGLNSEAMLLVVFCKRKQMLLLYLLSGAFCYSPSSLSWMNIK